LLEIKPSTTFFTRVYGAQLIFGVVINNVACDLSFLKGNASVRALLNNVNIAFMSLTALYFAVWHNTLVYYAVINAHIAVRGILDLIFGHLKRVP